MIIVVLLMVLVSFVRQPVGGFLHVLVLLLYAIGVAVHHRLLFTTLGVSVSGFLYGMSLTFVAIDSLQRSTMPRG